MFVLILTYTKPLSEIDKHVVAHRAYLDECFAKGQLICSGPQIPREGGVIFSCVKTRSEIETIVANDPFNIEGVADYKIIEFDAIKYAEGFKPFL